MNEEEITSIYETLAPMAGDYANAQAEQIGQAQRSMGTLAGQTMGATTSGLGNYTYNRLMRPQIDVMRDEILVEGYRNQLNKVLSDAYKTAQRNYANSSGGGTGSNTSNTGTNLPTEINDTGKGGSSYQHTGVVDKDTGQWIDLEQSEAQGKDILSGESEKVWNPFEWIGDVLSGKESNRNAWKDYALKHDLTYSDNGEYYFLRNKEGKVIGSGRL